MAGDHSPACPFLRGTAILRAGTLAFKTRTAFQWDRRIP